MDDAALPSLERVWEVATRGKLRDIEQVLARFPAGRQLADPRAIALRGIKNVLAADVPGGIALLRRAVEHSEGRLRQYLVDLVVPLVVSVGDFTEAEALLDEIPDVVHELAPAYLGSRAVIAAREGYDDRSRAYANEALAIVRESVEPMVVARTLQRVGLAAFYTEDYERAQEISLEAARAYERIGALRAACNAYSVLYAIAVGWLGDPVIARSYATRISTIAEADGDLSMQNLGLVAQLEIAAESGDDTRYASTRARLLANPLHEQYRERFSFVLAEILTSAWAGRFQQARSAILGVKKRLKRSGISAAEAMLCDALLALFEVARWNVEEARALAHSVISRTTVHPDQEPLFESQRRRAARILAAAACIITGETTRGRRALSRAYDPDAEFVKLDPVRGLDEDAVAPLFRGYARLLNAVCAAAAHHRPQFGLTKAEMEILLALPSGDSVAEIATALNKSKRTVESQLEKIYAKMEVSTRAQAVAKARALGLEA